MPTISFINMKGGVGKTTLATNIADCLNRRYNKKVLLIDIDPQFNATQCLFGVDEYIKYCEDGKDTIITVFEDTRTIARTVEGLSEKQSKPLEDIRPYEFCKDFHILPGNLNLYRMEMASGLGKENRLKKYIKKIQETEKYDYIIIDTPPTPSVWMTSALIASDYYLIPVKPDPISYIGIDLLENIIENKRENLDLKIKCIGLVFTMVERPDAIVYQNAVLKIKSGKWNKFKYKKYIPKRTDIAKWQLNKSFILDVGDERIKSSLINIIDEKLC